MKEAEVFVPAKEIYNQPLNRNCDFSALNPVLVAGE
jgi:hypothetical protein